MWQMWSDADKLLLNVTPRILNKLSRVISGSGSGRVFKFPHLLSQKRTSFSLRLFSVVQAAMLAISAALVLTLVVRITR